MELIPGRDELVAACRGVYRLRDVARHFDISTVQVERIWARRIEAEIEPPNIWETHPLVDAFDVWILYERGHSHEEIAQKLGCTVSRVGQLLPRLSVYDREVMRLRRLAIKCI